MIKHIVLLKWKEGVSQESINLVTSEFARLKHDIAEIVSYEFGADMSIYKGNADYALIAEFSSESDFHHYVQHEKHQSFLKNIAEPILESFQSIQINANI